MSDGLVYTCEHQSGRTEAIRASVTRLGGFLSNHKRAERNVAGQVDQTVSRIIEFVCYLTTACTQVIV